MTREKWSKMTADERRIKVAELCGWKNTADPEYPGDTVWVAPNDRSPSSLGAAGYGLLPYYETDLNAMHEAEKIIIAKKVRRNQVVPRGVYESMLIEATGGFAWRATAAQRAEAFVLTLGSGE
jgi:hypothetical protein